MQVDFCVADLEALRRAAKIHEKALRRGVDAILSGATDLDVVLAVEKEIEEAKPAFPVNICSAHVAAHYTPDAGESRPLHGLVKLDVGVHVDGWITDAAVTVDLDGSWKNIARASYVALQRAIEVTRPGVRLMDVGETIWRTAKEFGVKPIRNLGGHQIERYNLHAGLFVPNVPEGSEKIEEGMILAIEPFMTNGEGLVRESNSVHIFSLRGSRARSPQARSVLAYVRDNFGPLPFALRWLEERFGRSVRLAVVELVRLGSLHQYPVLVERKGSQVAQFETTVFVDRDGAQPLVDVSGLADI